MNANAEMNSEILSDYEDYIKGISEDTEGNGSLIKNESEEVKRALQDAYDCFFELGQSHETGVYKKWGIQLHKLSIIMAVANYQDKITVQAVNRAFCLMKYYGV